MRHDQTRCAVSDERGAGDASDSGGGSGSGRDVADGGGPSLRGLPRFGEWLDEARHSGWREGASDGTAWTAEEPGAAGTRCGASGSEDHRGLPGPAPPALRSLDARGRRAASGPGFRAVGLRLDRGPVPEELGSDPAEARAPGLREGSRGRGRLAQRAVPGHRRQGEVRRGRDSLG